MSEKCYSVDEENFSHEDMEDAVREAFDYAGAKPGDERTIYEGVAKKETAGGFVPAMDDLLAEAAYDECGEYAEDWLEGLTPDQRGDLADRVKAAVNSWADDHWLQPTFYTVENVREIKVRLLDDYDNFEEV